MRGADGDQMAMLRWDYRTALIDLEDQVLTLGRRAQSLVPLAMSGVATASGDLARRILAADDELDVGVHEAEAEIVRLLTLQAPVADEMRLLLGLSKVAGSVERIGDHCVNIARVGAELAQVGVADPELARQVQEMGLRAERAVRTGLDAFSQRRTDGVSRVERVEDQLDLLYEGITARLLDHAEGGRPQLEWAVRMVLVARQLERIGDHGVSVAEEGAFIATGDRRAPRALRT